MKKHIWLFLLFFTISLQLHAQSIGEEDVSFESQKSEWGLGIEGGFGAATLVSSEPLFAGFPDAWWAITLHISETSFLLSAGMTGLGNQNSYGLNANIDFMLATTPLTNWLELHIFLGLGASIFSYSNNLGLSAGLRLPLGISFWLLKWFQAYVNITPIVGFGLGFGSDPRIWVHFDAPLDIGIRFWF